MAGRATWPLARPAAERRVALIVVIAFLIAGSAWILFTDLLLYSFIQDPTTVARIETAKGWAFVALAGLFLYVVTLRSTAQLGQATRTISAVVESIGDGVLLLGPERTIAYANRASIQMLGLANLDDLLGMGAAEFSRRFHVSYPDGHLVPPDQFVSQRVFDESGPIRYKAVLYPPGQREVVIFCTAAGVRTEIGMPAELVVSVMHDITATEHLDRHRDELFTAAAHAFKTPVTVIKSATQVLSACASADARRSTAVIERQCARIERLIENLLALSRIRSGTLQLYPVDVDLRPMLEDVAEDVARLSTGHEVHVRLHARPRVHADRERLAMILRNAIHAATRLSVPGGPVTVGLERCGTEAQIGITYRQPRSSDGEPAEASQAHDDFDDMGVSRYVTETIVEAHGGTLTERMDHGETTVQIRIPAVFETT